MQKPLGELPRGLKYVATIGFQSHTLNTISAKASVETMNYLLVD